MKVKKAAVTSGKALNLVEEAELSEPEEDLPIGKDDASEASAEDKVEQSDQSTDVSEEISAENLSVSEDAAEDSKEEKRALPQVKSKN